MDKSVLIVGYGVVGHNLASELVDLHPDVYDIKFTGETRSRSHYDFAFICVDTPATEKSYCDVCSVIQAIRDNDADIYVIKSTVLPGVIGALKMLPGLEGKHLVFSPEYYGGTQHCNNFDFDFTILGGDREDCLKVQQLLQGVYDGRHIFRITDDMTACLAKYMENCWLATKVSFCNQFYEVAKNLKLSYEELRELFVLDPRVNPSHTFVYEDHPYWESHCLNKDVPAIAKLFGMPFMVNVIEYNESQKEKYKKGCKDEPQPGKDKEDK